MPTDGAFSRYFSLSPQLLTGVVCLALQGAFSLPAFAADSAPAPAPVAPVTAAVPSAARASAWQQRNSPPAVEAAANALLAQLVLDDTQQQYTGLSYRPALKEVAKLAKENKPVDAIRTFERYFLSKLRNPNAYGLSTDDVSAYARGIGGLGHWPQPFLTTDREPKVVLEQAKDLLDGLAMFGGKKTTLGAPGQVNWRLPLEPAQAIDQLADPRPYRELFTFIAFTPLLEAYMLTKDEAYLSRWLDYLDDWALNNDYLEEIHPCFVPSGTGQAGGLPLQFARLFGTLALALPADREVIPPQLFARVLVKVLPYPLIGIVYIRNNPHNWTPHVDNMVTALIYDEFKPAAFFFREARRRNIEDYAVTQNLRDGGENQQCPWYNFNYLNMISAFRLLDYRSSLLPSWKELPWVNELRRDTAWRAEVEEHLREHMRLLIHLRTPQNQRPLGLQGGDTGSAEAMPGEGRFSMASDAAVPEAYWEPDNAQIMAAVSGTPFSPPPSFTDEWFPYAGYNIVRTGWKIDDGHGLLFCSPKPGSYGGYRSRSNNNFFGLGAFGQYLLVEDTTHHYMPVSSPISVDGRMQHFLAGIGCAPPIAGHKRNMSAAWTEPVPWRWHASERFNLMEGVYAGPYAQDYNALPLTLDKTLQGVEHQRLVLYARQHGLWIVTDRMRNPDEHVYEQIWRLPIKPFHLNAFVPEDITADAAAQTIRTDSQGETSVKGVAIKQANVSLYHVGPMTLAYNTQNEPKDEKKEPFRKWGYGWQRIGAKWTGKGDQQLITVIFPRRPGTGPEGDLKGIKKIALEGGVSGVDAETPAGGVVQFRAATSRDGGVLEIGQVRIRGEALLVAGGEGRGSREKGQGAGGESYSGIALGCTEMSIAGKPVVLPSADFEFSVPSTLDPATLDKAYDKARDKTESIDPRPAASLNTEHRTLNTLPIYRPIDPVAIEPNDHNVFADNLAFTLSSRTPGVEIHYTLDGTDPTPQSPLYTGPVELQYTTTVKARAYRPGVKENPVQLSGTHATVPSLAVFTRTEPLEPSAAAAKKPLAPGLTCDYFEGDWMRLWLSLDQVKPLKTAVVPALFDTGLLPAENPPVGQAAAPRARTYALQYNGYFLAPEDGVYTFHAPREWTMPDIDAGYELQLYLGDKIVPWGWGTRAFGLNQWYPSTRLHAFGNWSIALKKGAHRLQLFYLDYRTDAAKRLNQPGLTNYVWDGATPDLRVTGPGVDRQPIPAAWLAH